MGPYLIMVLTLANSIVTPRIGVKILKHKLCIQKGRSCVPSNIWKWGQGKEKTSFVTRIGWCPKVHHRQMFFPLCGDIKSSEHDIERNGKMHFQDWFLPKVRNWVNGGKNLVPQFGCEYSLQIFEHFDSSQVIAIENYSTMSSFSKHNPWIYLLTLL